jgi:rubredoxin
MRGKWRATVGPQDWACRRCHAALGTHDGQHLQLTGGELLRSGVEWGEMVVRCTTPDCGAVWVWWPANVPASERAKLVPTT